MPSSQPQHAMTSMCTDLFWQEAHHQHHGAVSQHATQCSVLLCFKNPAAQLHSFQRCTCGVRSRCRGQSTWYSRKTSSHLSYLGTCSSFLLPPAACREEAGGKDCKSQKCDIILWVVCCHAYYTITSSTHATSSVACTGMQSCFANTTQQERP